MTELKSTFGEDLESLGIRHLVTIVKEDDLQQLERVLAGRNVPTFINQRAKDTGSTALQAACKAESHRKTLLLLQAGAQLQADSKGEKPKVENLFKTCGDFTPIQKRSYFSLKNDEEALFSLLVSTEERQLGIQHTVEKPNLADLLRTWEAADDTVKEEAERRVLEAFGGNIQMTSIPMPSTTGGEEREKLVEIIEKWNNNHRMKCEYL